MMFSTTNYFLKSVIFIVLFVLITSGALGEIAKADLGKQKIEELKKERTSGRSEELFNEIFEIYRPDHLDVASVLVDAGFSCVGSVNNEQSEQPDIRCGYVRCNKIYRWNWKGTRVSVVTEEERKKISAGTVNYAWACPGPIKRKKFQRFNLEQDETGWVDFKRKR